MFPQLPEQKRQRDPLGGVSRWARQEAKSEAMVGDVLASHGADEGDAADYAAVRRGRWTVLAFVSIAVAALIAGIFMNAVPPQHETEQLRDHLATDGPRRASDRDMPRLWGPFRP